MRLHTSSAPQRAAVWGGAHPLHTHTPHASWRNACGCNACQPRLGPLHCCLTRPRLPPLCRSRTRTGISPGMHRPRAGCARCVRPLARTQHPFNSAASLTAPQEAEFQPGGGGAWPGPGPPSCLPSRGSLPSIIANAPAPGGVCMHFVLGCPPCGPCGFPALRSLWLVDRCTIASSFQ